MFTNNALSFLNYFWPETILIIGVLAIIIWDLVKQPAPRAHSQALAIGFTIAAAIAALWIGMRPPAELYGGLLVMDGFATFFKVMAAVSTILAVIFMMRAREYEGTGSEGSAEFHAILLVTTLGVFLLASAKDLLTIFIGLETISITSYILAGYHRKDRRASEAALKYVIYGGVASGAMLYGMSLMYGATGGATQLDDIRLALMTPGAGDMSEVLTLSVVLIVAGFGYKIAAAPFHMWCPDVYEGAPTPVAAFFSVGPKLAGFAVLIRFFYGMMYEPGGTFFEGAKIPWQPMIAIMAVASMTIGNLAALQQTNMKRLLAYSSIAHVGYLLMGISVATPDGVAAVVFYLVVYLAMNMGAFLLVIAVSHKLGSKDDPAEEIESYRGLGTRAPLAAVLMAIFLFSLTGLPPLGGFIGKYYLFASVISKGGVWFTALAVVGVINSAISLYYYARVVKVMFLDETAETSEVRMSPLHTVPMLLLAAPVLILGVAFGPVLRLAHQTVKFIGI